jgi:hypothetical protein
LSGVERGDGEQQRKTITDRDSNPPASLYGIGAADLLVHACGIAVRGRDVVHARDSIISNRTGNSGCLLPGGYDASLFNPGLLSAAGKQMLNLCRIDNCGERIRAEPVLPAESCSQPVLLSCLFLIVPACGRNN